MALTDEGYEVPTLQEVFNDIATRQRTVFPDINLDPATPDGQLTGLFAEVILTAYEVAAGIYNGLDPRTATGIMLDRVVSLNGINRKQPTKSHVVTEFTGTVGAIIPPGTTVADTNTPPRQFETVRDVTITDPSGKVESLAYAKEFGAMTIPADTVTEIINPIPDVTGVNNPSPGVSGTDLENDNELRVRREISLMLQSRAMVDSVYSGILEITNVVAAKVYENSENADSPDGIPPHSLYCVVEGGTDIDVANAIMENKSLGCGLHGSTSVVWQDMQDFAHTVKFDRPAEVEIFMSIVVASPSYGAHIEEQVKELILQYVEDVRNFSAECIIGSLGIGDEVQAATFYAALSGQTDFTAVNILVGLVDPATETVVSIGINEISSFAEARITVTKYT